MNGKQIRVQKTGKVGVLDHTQTINGKTLYLVCFDESNQNIENGGTLNLVLYKEDAIEFI
jgi:hypothetical protein